MAEAKEASPELIQEWIEAVLETKLDGGLLDNAKDGLVFCKLLNKLFPSSAIKYKKTTVPFLQMENIKTYLSAVRKLGLQDHECFETTDVVNKKNPTTTYVNLRALERLAVKQGWTGPTFASIVQRREDTSWTIQTAREWLEGISGRPLPGRFLESIKDGSILCEAINTYSPGKIPQISRSSLPIHRMENIEAFLNAAKDFGVPPEMMFTMKDFLALEDPELLAEGIILVAKTLFGEAAEEGEEEGEEEADVSNLEMPEGWVEAEEEGHPYYIFAETGDWQWTHPALGIKTETGGDADILSRMGKESQP